MRKARIAVILALLVFATTSLFAAELTPVGADTMTIGQRMEQVRSII